MAEEIRVKLVVDTANGSATIKQLESSLESMKKKLEEVKTTAPAIKEVANAFKEVKEEIVLVPGSIGAIKASVKEMMKEISNVEIGSQKFKELEQQIFKANSELKNTKNDLKGATDEQIIGSFVAIGKGAVAGFATASSAVSLFAGKSQTAIEVQKAAAKAQEYLTLVQSVGAVQMAIHETREARMLILQKGRIVITQGLAAAQAILNAIMSANPIALIVLAVAGLVTGFILLKDKVKIIGEAFNFLGNIASLLLKPLKAVGEALGFISDEQTKKVGKSLEEQRQMVTGRYDHEIELMKAAGKKDTDIIEARKLAWIKSYQEMDIAHLESNNNRSEDDEKKLKELKQKLQETNDAIQINEVETAHRIAEEKKKATEDAEKKAKDAAEKRKKALEDEKKARADEVAAEIKADEDLQKTRDAEAAHHAELRKKEEDAIHHRAEIAEATEKAITDTTLINLDIRIKAAHAGSDEQIELIKQKAAEEKAIREKEHNEQLAALYALNALGVVGNDEYNAKVGEANAQFRQKEVDAETSTQEQIKQQRLAALDEFQQGVSQAQNIIEGLKEIENIAADQNAQNEAKRLKQFDRDQDHQKKGLKAKLDAGVITQAQYDKKIQALDEKSKQEKADSEQKLADQKKAILKKYAAIEFAISLAQIIVNTAKGIMAAAPVIPLMVLTGVAGAVEAAVAYAQYQKIQSLATGGMVHGPGGPTDDAVPARLSAGESVINARSTSMFRPLLSAINVAGGGVAFDGSRRSKFQFAEGGVAEAVGISNVSDPGIGDRIDKLIESLDRPQRVYVVETDIREASNKVKVIESRATFAK